MTLPLWVSIPLGIFLTIVAAGSALVFVFWLVDKSDHHWQRKEPKG